MTLVTLAAEQSMNGRDRRDEENEARHLEQARRLGEAEAELVHLRLSLKESLAREKRLIEGALSAEEALEDALTTEHNLRQEVARYADFHAAVQRSRPWRVIQFLRRLVGRQW